MRSLEAQIAVITGGARGLGEAITRTLASAGATVIAADVRIEQATRVAEDLKAQGCRAEAVELNLLDAGQIQAAVEQIAREHGRIDILVNNAGTDKTVSVEEMTLDDWDTVIGVNLRAPFLMAKAVFPFMRAQGGGQIVNITSTAAKRAWANASAYHASKWGLLGLSHALHVEGRPQHIKVTALVAGGMRTPFLLDRFPDIDQETLQDPKNVAQTVLSVLTLPEDTVIPEVMVLPMRETSWP
jgi:NAD(P)-dependent dehydrogenase (short-subunit alcohol dehydrogenase family)